MPRSRLRSSAAMRARWLVAVSTSWLAACHSPPPDPPPPPPPPPTAEELASFAEAREKCESEDDCEALAKEHAHGHASWRDEERRMAASLKSCAAGNTSVCLNAVFMRRGRAAPGSRAILEAACAQEGASQMLCEAREGLDADEANASAEVKRACETLSKTPATAPPGEIGPLVDRCPGRATAAQRARARLFRDEASISAAFTVAKTGSPRQMRRFVERLAPTNDPRANEILALGVQRFGRPKDETFRKAREAAGGVQLGGARMVLCAIEGDAAYFYADYPRPSGLTLFARFVLPLAIAPLYPFFLMPDAKPSNDEQKAIDDRQKAAAREAEAGLTAITGAPKLVLVPTCDDVKWFEDQPNGGPPR